MSKEKTWKVHKKMGMMRKQITLGLIVLILSGFLVGCSRTTSTPDANNIQSKAVQTAEWEPKSSSGAVTIKLTPKGIVQGAFIVEIAADTHSVDNLDTYDLREITTLYAGKTPYKPIKAPGLRGHHNFGELAFDVKEAPSHFTITINDLHDAGVRTFTWP